MKGIAFIPGFIVGLVNLGIILPAFSQVTSDNTTNTTVNINNNNFNILNGIQKGNNLFHSFKEFSIPTGSSATFNNSTDVVNIINRVTGGNISNIDGLIKANGSANLFLINPAGIVFGENASLNIGGSFFGSTAESILFEDGFKYSAIDSQQTPLLTISVPLGLQMGSNSRSITVNGNGHALTGGISFPSLFNNTDTGLQVNPGQTLGLIGAGINFTGGIIRVPGGNIQLSSIEQGTLKFKFDNNSQTWQFDTSQLESFGDINLSNKSFLDTSGFLTGNIQLQGRNISFNNGSVALIQNLGNQPVGQIIVDATDSIQLANSIRNAPDTITPLGIIKGVIPSTITTQNLGTGEGGDIFVSGKNLLISNGSSIVTNSYNNQNAGNIDINIDSLISIRKSSPLDPIIFSAIATNTFDSGNSGNLNISAENIELLDAGIISATNLGSSQGGDIRVDVDQDLTIIGSNEIFSSSGIYNNTFKTGNSGRVTVNTSRLSIFNGGTISSSTWAEGNAKELIINARESVTINGSRITEMLLPSGIVSDAIILGDIARQALGLPDQPSGDSGNLILNTPSLTITDGGRVSVINEGLGNSGNLQLNTDQIYLDNKSSITGLSVSGKGGNIELNVRDSLVLRHSSTINSEAKGTENGGNITINSPVIAGFENSDIIANAVKGNGGNIDITTQGIFGLEFRDALTTESDITASSEFGMNGTVAINNISIDPSSGIVSLPVNLADSSQQIASGCSSNTGSTFVATGRGGIPTNPSQSLNLNSIWSDIRDLSVSGKRNNNSSEVTTISSKPAIVEATRFMRNEKGEIELVAAQNTPFSTKQILNCKGNT